MKKLFFMSIASMITLTGCGSNEHELIQAIDNSYDLSTGQIVSKFDYTTEYNNIEIAGTVKGLITIDFGKDVDKISAQINFEGNEDAFEYYVDNKGNIIADNEQSLYAPLYIDAPDLSEYLEELPEPVYTVVDVDGVETPVNQYTLLLEEMSTPVAKSIFDPIIKMGFVSSDVLQLEKIKGDFTLNYYVNPETGLLVSETLDYTNSTDDGLNTKTTIHIENSYSYEENEVSLPTEEASADVSEASEGTN
ncbi:hypothetical protein RZE82_04405 [Mollicutes bacterium LVI A0039]|nr:hypothetical protein RZE82_04405 [Mollicutes bacterium LVI A0039]